jgi:hypothetical protein
MRSRLICVFITTVIPISRAAVPPDPLHHLTEFEKRTLVLAALEKRQTAIANLHYKLQQEVTNIEPDGARRPMGHDHYEFRLHAAGQRLHHVRYRNGKLRSEWFLNRTRTESRGLSRLGEDKPWIGSIRAGEDQAWRTCAFNQILGFRILEDGEPQTLLQWIRNSLARGLRVEFTSLDAAGKPFIDVSVYEGFRRKTFHLDPARGWIPVRTEYLYQAPNGGGYNKEHTDVTQFAEFDGVWLPIRAVRRSGMSASRIESETVYAVTEMKVGRVTEADLEILFPPNIDVHNNITGAKYHTDPDGRLGPP